MITGGDKLTI